MLQGEPSTARNSSGALSSPESMSSRSSSSPLATRVGISPTTSPASNDTNSSTPPSFVLPRAPLRVLPSQRSSNVSVPAKRKCEDSDDKNFEIHGSLLELFLSLGADLTDISSATIKKICVSFWGPEFPIPSVQEFSTTIFEHKKKAYFKELLLEGLFEFLYVYTTEVRSSLYVVSFAVTQENRLLYISDELLQSDKKNDWENMLQNFCNTSVKIFHQKYGSKALFLVYDSNLNLNDVGLGNTEHEYVIVRCFSHLINHIKNTHEGFSFSRGSANLDKEHRIAQSV